MQRKAVETEQILTLAEVNEIQEALRKGCGGMVVVPLKDGRRLTPHLVPVKPSGDVNLKVLGALESRLRSLGCECLLRFDSAGLVGETDFNLDRSRSDS